MALTDIVERLRDKHCCDNGCHCDEAADEIERLRAALEEITKKGGPDLAGCIAIARAALPAIAKTQETKP
jgi:hypothetical protein